ncbi:hypothetical protein M083_1273 [Bacteroides fragilis str. 3986 T(B)9]|nr:hypothetical protein M111_1154 [Bacteroides fragilis str. 3986T(B)10]EXY71020.1 hypothetical protein M083_1273 [Bacteroides fragilis str. 3986 T(B)9]EYA51735.1 hypothetical protein M114_3222 [Bacteroides fragilis str. 3986 N(B)22]EYA57881.1 hypothetical protein M112_1363 [Bacteroides fragilis str. 3986 T(B)13]EYE69339.1 hypothetical protein M113_1354 [Bacteroides fragilis str. 3986 N3]
MQCWRNSDKNVRHTTCKSILNYRKKRGNRPILKWQCSLEGYTENILYPVK